MSPWLVPVPGRPTSRRQQESGKYELRSCASATGLEVSPGGFLEDSVIQGDIGHQLLQPAVLLLQFLKSLCLIHPHAAVLFAPAVIGLLGDTQLPANFTYRGALAEQYISLTQLINDLLGFECLFDHWLPPFLLSLINVLQLLSYSTGT